MHFFGTTFVIYYFYLLFTVYALCALGTWISAKGEGAC
jgi:hypothetical protein